MHIFNMLVTSVQMFKSIACMPLEELMLHTCHPILKPNRKIVFVKNLVNLSQIIFIQLQKSHKKTTAKSFQYINNISAKFQIDCLHTLGGVDYTNLLPYTGLNSKLSKSKMPSFCQHLCIHLQKITCTS